MNDTDKKVNNYIVLRSKKEGINQGKLYWGKGDSNSPFIRFLESDEIERFDNGDSSLKYEYRKKEFVKSVDTDKKRKYKTVLLKEVEDTLAIKLKDSAMRLDILESSFLTLSKAVGILEKIVLLQENRKDDIPIEEATTPVYEDSSDSEEFIHSQKRLKKRKKNKD